MPVISSHYRTAVGVTAMTVVLVLAFVWLSARTLLLLLQVQRHTPEAHLGREFQRELRQRGLMPCGQIERQP